SIWLGMDGYGLVLVENKPNPTFKQYAQQSQNKNGIQSNTVFTFFLNAQKRFWYSNSNSGIAEVKYVRGEYNFIQYPDNTQYPWLYPVNIEEDSNGLFWIKALDGTMIFEPQSK